MQRAFLAQYAAHILGHTRPEVRLTVARQVACQHHAPRRPIRRKPQTAKRNREQRHPSLFRNPPIRIPNLVIAVVLSVRLRPRRVRLHAGRVHLELHATLPVLERVQQHNHVVIRSARSRAAPGATGSAPDACRSTQTPRTASVLVRASHTSVLLGRRRAIRRLILNKPAHMRQPLAPLRLRLQVPTKSASVSGLSISGTVTSEFPGRPCPRRRHGVTVGLPCSFRIHLCRCLVLPPLPLAQSRPQTASAE